MAVLRGFSFMYLPTSNLKAGSKYRVKYRIRVGAKIRTKRASKMLFWPQHDSILLPLPLQPTANVNGIRDSSVSITTRLQAVRLENWGLFLGQDRFLPALSEPALGPNQSPAHWVTRALSSAAKHGVKMTTPPKVVKNAWSYNNTSLYAFGASCLIVPRDFTLLLLLSLSWQ
jgi:hypothetical protein